MTMIWWWLAWWLKNWRAWRNKLKLPKARCWRPRTAANPKSKVSSQRKPEWVNRHLCLAIAEYGKPRFVRTDNERCFTGRAFSTGLALLGIKHQRIDLHCPWQNGRIERLFGTLKDKLRQIVLADGKAINLFLCDFRRRYNEIRPHQNLQGRTPLEAWNNVDPFHAPCEPKAVRFVEGWSGLLRGFHIRR